MTDLFLGNRQHTSAHLFIALSQTDVRRLLTGLDASHNKLETNTKGKAILPFASQTRLL
jgi:hypothetical protein